MTGRCLQTQNWMLPFGRVKGIGFLYGCGLLKKNMGLAPEKKKDESHASQQHVPYTEMAMNWGNDLFSDKPMHVNRIEQELFVGCLVIYPPKNIMFVRIQTTCFWFKGLWFGLVSAVQSSDSQVSRPSQEDYGVLSWRWDSWICWWIVIFPVVNPREVRYRMVSVSGKIWKKFFAAPFYRNPRITELQKSEIRRAVRVEDLHRASDLGISATNDANHTNDEADMEVKHGASHLSLRIQGDTDTPP